jgi:hypothetical protein
LPEAKASDLPQIHLRKSPGRHFDHQIVGLISYNASVKTPGLCHDFRAVNTVNDRAEIVLWLEQFSPPEMIG